MNKKCKILVIDDEVSLEAIYTNFLSEMEADVTYCDHPQKGWRQIEKEEYDLIITDLKMPVISGDEFISIVRESKLNIHTPIILCSGYINKLVITEMFREGKVYFLPKPFNCEALLEMVGKALGVKRSEPQATSTSGINEKWLQLFSEKLNELLKCEIKYESIKEFETWNFDTLSINFYQTEKNSHLSVTLLMKLKTFLKIAGTIQGTHYKDIGDETLSVWQDVVCSVSNGATNGGSRPTFSKVLRQEIITLPGQSKAFYQFETPHGEIFVYLN